MKTTHLTNILNDLINGQTLSSADIFASNCNQYFCTIKNNGIELIEIKVPNKKTKGYHLARKLSPKTDNIKKARDFLIERMQKHSK